MDLRKVSAEIVQSIILDLCDRRGLKHEWNAIEPEIRTSVRLAWERAALDVLCRMARESGQ